MLTQFYKKDFDFPLLIDDYDKEHYYLQVNEEEFGEYRSTPKNLSNMQF